MNSAPHLARPPLVRRSRLVADIGAALVIGTALAACSTPDIPRITGSVSSAESSTKTVDDGHLPGKVAVTDVRYAAIANLKPAIRKALNAAATDARAQGIEILVTSGWRSADYQRELLNEAIAKYGSKQQAAKWVADPAKSAHVSGDAVDLGPMKATDWLAKRGAKYGLCQTYANETWHYELRPQATTKSCPAMYADPTKDPRLN